MDVDLALSTIGFGCAQVVIMVVCMVLCVYSVTEDYVVAYLLVLTSCEFGTKSGGKTLLANSTIVGMVISGLIIGVFADKYGRKLAIQLSLIGSLFFSFIASLMPEIYSMAIMRLMVGCFLNGPASLGIGYLMEFYVPKWHALAVSISVQGIAFGLFYNPAMGWAILPSQYSWRISSHIEFRTWRFYMWLVTIPGWLALLGLFFVPESPYFLMYADRVEKATETLQWVCRLNGKKWDELDITLSKRPGTPVERGRWKEFVLDTFMLFKPPILRNFLISLFYIFGIFFISLGFGVWYPAIRNTNNENSKTLCQVVKDHNIFKKAGNESETCNDQMTNFVDPMFYALNYMVIFLEVTVLVLCLPRRFVMALHVGVACLLGIALNFIAHPMGVLVAFTLMLVVPGVLIGLALSTLASCVPVELRGKALCMVRSIARLGAVVGSTLVGVLMKYSCTVTLNIFVVYMAVCVLLALSLPKELRTTIGLKFTRSEGMSVC